MSRKRSVRCRRLLAESLEDRRMLAGPYAPAAGEIGSTAIAAGDPAIVAWATGVANYTAGTNVDLEFQTPLRAIGPAEGTSGDVVSLGRGGQITLTFDDPIRDGIGPDFAVFENGFSDTFLELAYVEVSSDGSHFFRFPNDSLTPSSVDAFGVVDPTEIQNLAGKYRQGFGTPFDLEELADVSPLLDLTSVTHVRLIDIVGDGSQSDSDGDPIFDPYPTIGSAGVDIDAVAVLHKSERVRDVVGFEDVGETLASESAFRGPDPDGNVVEGPFEDSVVVGAFQSETLSFNNAYSIDFESWTGWAYSNATNTVTPGFANQFSSFAGGGKNGSATFGIGFPDQGDFVGPATLTRLPTDTRRLESLAVTNTTYAALSMRDGDPFAKKFGGTSGNDPDFLLLTITGKDASDASIGTVEFYLADYRFDDNSLDYIVDQWVDVDLRPIAAARSLEFAISSSDVGPFGINTPAFFAVDDITLTQPVLALDIADREVVESDGAHATIVRISRPDSDTSAAIEIILAPVDAGIATVPTSVTIAAGDRYVEFPIATVNNDLFDGTRQITIAASSEGLIGTSGSLTILDDDLRTLSFSGNPVSLAEGISRTVTLTRNDADLAAPLTVQIESSDSSRLDFTTTVTLDANQASSTFTITAVEDDVDQPDADVTVVARATGYVDASTVIRVTDNDQPEVSISVAANTFSESDAAPSARFESLGKSLPPESFDNGADLAGGFISEGLFFNNDFNSTFGSWSGWSYSNTTDTTTAGFSNQYSVIAGGGANGSDTYAVAAAFEGALVPSIARDPAIHSGFQSLEISNTTYAALSMLRGDDFAKKFGGESGDDPDFFLLTIEGFDDGEASLGTIDFYLADFRFSDNELDFLVDQWTTVDVSSLASAVELRFSLSSSDVGTFGMNTPAYFAVDNVTLAIAEPPPMATISRNTSDVSSPLDVVLTSSDTSEFSLPAMATIPAGESSVTVPLSVFDDDLVDGDQSVVVGVSADAHGSANVSVTVSDDDAAALTLTILTPSIGEASGEGRAALHRNVDDINGSLVVDLSALTEDQLILPGTVTIPVGSRSTLFTFAAKDNAIVDENRTVIVRAVADGFASSEHGVSIVNDDVPPPTLSLELDRATLSEADAPQTILLEDIGATLAEQSVNNGSDHSGGFDSNGVRLNNTFDSTFGSWGGWSISNTTDVATPGFANQYSAIAGGGAHGSSTYAVASAFPGGTIPTISLENPQVGQGFDSLMITNTTYAALSMSAGDPFAKKFGGPDGDDPDFFVLTIEGRDPDGQSVGTVDFYLADFRFADNAQDYIVDSWTTVDVSSLLGATSLEFSLASSDVGQFGMNTPAYFAVDNIVLSGDELTAATATVSRSDADLSLPLVVQIDNADRSEVSLPATVVIPSGSASATFKIHAVDDALVDGSQTVQLTAFAADHTSSSASLTVQDDDDPTLTLSLADAAIDEAAGSTATELLVYRNSEDLGLPLSVQLAVTGSDLDLAATITIPSGKASLLVPFGAIDNVIHDGDRTATITATSESFVSASVLLSVQDDEVARLVVEPRDAGTTISELFGQDIVHVSLASQPLSNVLIDIVFLSDDLTIDVTSISFTPDDWNQRRVITVTGIPDLELEEDETVPLTFRVDPQSSDPSYSPVADSILDVVIEDHQPTTLRLGEDAGGRFLLDVDADVRIASGSYQEAIEIVANDRVQTIHVDRLAELQGSVVVDASGGDDSVIVRGTHFSALRGGQGYDRLVLKLDELVELVTFMEGRVFGFEEIVVSSDSGAELQIDAQRLSSVVPPDAILLVRVEADQKLAFLGEATSVAPVMVGTEFAQVIRSGEFGAHVISPAPWQNVLNIWDVNQSGDVTALDALAVVNQLPKMTDPSLPILTSLADFTGAYFDVSGDEQLTALDALQVINEIARRFLRGDGEAISRADGQAVLHRGKHDNTASAISLASAADGMIVPPARKTAVYSVPHDEAIRQMYRPDGDPSRIELGTSIPTVDAFLGDQPVTYHPGRLLRF